MSFETKNKLDLSTWLAKNTKDPACKNFLSKLKNHLLTRLQGLEYDGDEREYSTAERNQVIIEGNAIYRHPVLCVNYTTYDMRRNQDSLNVSNSADFMVLGCENEANSAPHPYWYGRIIGIFHAKIVYRGPGSRSSDPQIMEFLWVRWLGRDPNNGYHEGWRRRRLPRVGFVFYEDAVAFGFLNPTLIIRAVHLIPCFALGRTKDLLPQPSICRLAKEEGEDWDMFYVNIFVDRDMFMRYRGGGVGHKSIQKAIQRFCDDRWPEELKAERENTEDNSPVQREDDSDDEEDTGAEDLSSRPIGPDIDDVELPEGEAESESEQEGPEYENDESENDAEDKNDEPENDADEAGSDDDGYADL
ncbi:hypothetical protein M378DRAFT_134292 [Amanita muscaria Koide BX008]|uniref:Uncharacterized protein n=1 Tax=Amanita muscaria (strain Koide BX008) TaxID=946122 RepID=A0A0C2W1J8_AMAMK|nr:hypothetical protein M378DRAFT_134292 [Amanita muscaria Koide BX008]